MTGIQRKIFRMLQQGLFVALILGIAEAQAQNAPQINEHLTAARTTAGTEWASAFDYFCSENQVANAATDPEVEPTKVFDNLYFIGNKGTLAYALTTSDGIILIDAGYADKVESVLLAGMKKLSLDPAKIKLIIVTHGHADHFGGAAFLQDHYGAKVISADWDMMQPRPGATGAAPPKKDIVAIDGQPITLGDVTVTPVLVPGHTPGSLGLIFPVRDRGQAHMAALFGGTILLPGRPTLDILQQYLGSIDHFAEFTLRMHVDVEVVNHPLMDGTFEKAAKLQTRTTSGPNPFVVGEGGYGRFLTLMSECIKVAIARRPN